MGEVRRIEEAGALTGKELAGDTPTLRLFSLLELIASKDRLFTLQGLVEETGMAKPTLHRMLQQLEGAGLLIRENNGRHYGIGARLRRMAENLLLNDSHHGARHAVLRDLVEELGESCNLTTLSGNEIVYLDRVETPEPLRFTLQAGSRVPAHCSASGKMILSQLAPAQRRRLLEAAPLRRYTPNTVTDVDKIEEELRRVRRDGYAIDAEEFLPGLVCAAVLVPSPTGISNLGIAVQAPVMRLTPDKAIRLLPALRRAAKAIGDIEAEVAAGESSQESS
ncbi:IclR family transcriptional regulator [Mycolicibacterium agri]|uniref:IclR family transcriptional regulator n=1 Tax=Mycolicibacterium agri TaxID=36811 RepID=A0A2A7N0C7_MYCAG|nr:IclR family transcriptional regulator [Mycolicibacterium agri]PEG37492.1 IclR family transcriptional regulator [Mycolicibacterium agri]GFG50934.1 IclR family transcriptional regulator [Mycolicibacterium agri]